MIHPTSDVRCSCVPPNTDIWQYCVVLPEAIIGNNCNICAHVFIENDVVIGDNVTIKNGVQIWDGVHIEDNVFIGPNVTFTNDFIPRSKIFPDSFLRTIVRCGASIGANATIIGGCIIGENALVGAGSVVTSDIPAGTVWYGNPAKMKGYIDEDNKITHINLNKDKIGGGVKLYIIIYYYFLLYLLLNAVSHRRK